MNSWSDPRSGSGSEPYTSSVHPQPAGAALPPSTPLQTSAPLFPRRRENVTQPPPLTTSLSGVQFQAGGGVPPSPAYTSTPSSMASRPSGPFSNMRSPYTPSPADSVGLPSSARSRQMPYNAPYNPQQWVPMGSALSPNMGPGAFAPQNWSNVRSPTQRHEDTTGVPPPPYSPPHTSPTDVQGNAHHSPRALSQTTSPIPTSSQYGNAPIASHSEPVTARYHQVSRPRPVSMVYGGNTDLGGLAPQSTLSNFDGGSFNAPSPVGPRHGYNALNSPNSASMDPLSPNGLLQEGSTENSGQVIPPGSRRAVSTGDIRPGSSHTRTNGSDSFIHRVTGRWEPGMPLPPPPPGPPPGGTHRSRNSSNERSSRNGSIPPTPERYRSPADLEPVRGIVPPPPASRVDDTNTPDPSYRISAGHAITTDQPQDSSDSVVDELNDLILQDLASSSADHSQSQRTSNNSSPKGFRERRIESKQARSNPSPETDADNDTPTSWPADLVLANPSGPGLTRRRTMTRSTPRSARSNRSDSHASSGPSQSPAAQLPSTNSSLSTPRRDRIPTPDGPHGYVQTPPFSPDTKSRSASFSTDGTPNVPPKALPTPPLQTSQSSHPGSRLTINTPDQERPISHLLHIPIDGSQCDVPLAPQTPATQHPAPKTHPRPAGEDFVCSAIQRHQEFIQKEAAASSESESLAAFAEYVLAECKIRNQRYASADGTELFDTQSIREKLFEPVRKRRVQPTIVPPSIIENLSTSPSIGGTTDVRQQRVESGWWNNYKPSLSPIASMSMSNDEMSSRGRAPSRWWESQPGSDGSGRVKRSKQESKYMGVPREMREAMQLGSMIAEGDEQSATFDYTYPENPYATYGPTEYPPEKTGWHDQQSQQHQTRGRASSSSRGPPKLDISRFVTLPPPYPRHYPAVNNSHPDLTLYRTTVRTLSDLSEIQATKEAHRTKIENLQQGQHFELMEARRTFRTEMNNKIEQGTVSYAEAAEAEALRRVEEQKKERDALQMEFDTYQESVLTPLKSILHDRINIASTYIDDLQSKLFESSQHENPDQTQEEGDEQPELLEKLTQLKWLFEAREQLHREVYDLETERNERYQAIVSLPYKQSNNQEKIRETDNFFRRDAQDRQMAFATGTLRRIEKFMDIIEEKVGRGVELQLSAFWDIAPSLVEVLQKIPDDLRGFSVKISANEYDENPSYYRFPLQYLYSLLSHAGKSTYQFIESQINLLCFLHEVKSGLMGANCRFMEVQRIHSGEGEEYVKREMKELRDEEENRLTADLKDKVSTVESQWSEALGSQLQGVKSRVQEWLVQEGGWDEMVQMEQS